VKLYADEPGAETVRALEDVVVSEPARVEIPAAIWRKHRIGELSAENAGVLVELFESDWFGGAFAVVAVTGDVLEAAARSLARHPLRAYDSVQLAAAMLARSADPDLARFACFDATLATAARAEGFRPVA